jgi:hypothetical protein
MTVTIELDWTMAVTKEPVQTPAIRLVVAAATSFRILLPATA